MYVTTTFLLIIFSLEAVSIVILNIPTVNDGLNDFDKLFGLCNDITYNHCDIDLDFHNCRFLRQNAVAFLGGLIRYIQSQGRKIVNLDSLTPKVYQNLQENGFLHSLGFGLEPWQGDSIPYRENKIRDYKNIISYLQQQWLGRGWVDCSPCLQNEIVSNAMEIYLNAFEHGQTDIGIFSCGQYYPRMKILKLTIVDFGVGIPSNVRNFLNQTHLSAKEAIKWSFASGNATKPQNIPRGVGLDTLKEFVKVNNGQLEVFSHNGYAIIDNNQESYQNRDSYFGGTLVNITFQCNNCSYSLMSEYSNQSLF